jgi:hypothetical protein
LDVLRSDDGQPLPDNVDDIRLDRVDLRKHDIDWRGKCLASVLSRIRHEGEDEFADNGQVGRRGCRTYVQISAEQLAAKAVVRGPLRAVVVSRR